jgi:hypothetical protein
VNHILIQSISAKRGWLAIMTPFLLLVSCLVSLNLGQWFGSQPTDVVVGTATAVVTPPTPTPTTSVPTIPPAPTTTTTPTPAPTAYVPPPFTDSDIIQLLGPPAESRFSATTTLSFYWQWPLPLTEEQFFVVYFLTEDNEIRVGTVGEPNIGDGYRLHVDIEALKLTAVSLQWQVRLASDLTDEPLRVSEKRPLTLLENTP